MGYLLPFPSKLLKIFSLKILLFYEILLNLGYINDKKYLKMMFKCSECKSEEKSTSFKICYKNKKEDPMKVSELFVFVEMIQGIIQSSISNILVKF